MNWHRATLSILAVVCRPANNGVSIASFANKQEKSDGRHLQKDLPQLYSYGFSR